MGMALCRSYDQTACKIGVFVRLSANIEFGAAPEPLPALPDVCSDLGRDDTDSSRLPRSRLSPNHDLDVLIKRGQEVH